MRQDMCIVVGYPIGRSRLFQGEHETFTSFSLVFMTKIITQMLLSAIFIIICL